jgi:uncharacterized protein
MPLARSFLILHGIANHRPPEHWQHWLAQRLNADGHHVIYPALPDTDSPSLSAWIEALRGHLAATERTERVVVCHSLACLLWFHAAPLLTPAERANRLALVSPPASKRVPEAGASFRLDTFDTASVRRSVTDKIRVVASDNDPYNPDGAHALYARPLRADIDILPGAGHITPADGYGPWPQFKKWCHDPSRVITGERDR